MYRAKSVLWDFQHPMRRQNFDDAPRQTCSSYPILCHNAMDEWIWFGDDDNSMIWKSGWITDWCDPELSKRPLCIYPSTFRSWFSKVYFHKLYFPNRICMSGWITDWCDRELSNCRRGPFVFIHCWKPIKASSFSPSSIFLPWNSWVGLF